MLTWFLIYFWKGHGFYGVWKSPLPLNCATPSCCFVFPFHHKNFTPPLYTHISVHLHFSLFRCSGCTVTQLSLLFYSHWNVNKLTLVCCDFLSFYNAILQKYANEHSSCYSSETQHLLKCAKRVWSIAQVTEVLQSITKIDYKVNLIKRRQTS